MKRTCTPNAWQDNTNTAVLYPTEVKTYVLNIDSRFRMQAQSSSSTDFYIRLPRTYKNIIELKLTSIELPNTWYAFSEAQGETSMTISGTTVSIPEGNYDPLALAAAAQTAIRTVPGMSSATVDINTTSLLATINNSGNPFTMNFGTNQFCGSNTTTTFGSYAPYSAGLGYSLGFTGNVYTGSNSYTGEYVVDTLRDNYVLLQLPELDMMMDSFTYGNTSIRAFAKITVDVPKGELIYINGGDLVSRNIMFTQPTNVAGFRVKLVDGLGLPIDLKANFSFTLELQEVVSSKVYEAYRNNITC